MVIVNNIKVISVFMVLLSQLIAFIPDWFEQVDCFEYQTTCWPIMVISVLNQLKSYYRLATDNVALKSWQLEQ
jgi:hypothetical protein